MVEGGVVEGDFVVGTSATGSGGGSPADTGPSLRGGIEIDGESWRAAAVAAAGAPAPDLQRRAPGPRQAASRCSVPARQALIRGRA